MSIKYNISSLINDKLKNNEEEEKKEKIANEYKNIEKQPLLHENNEIKTAQATNDNSINNLKNKSASEIVVDLKNIETKHTNYSNIDAPNNLGLTKIDIPSKTDEELIRQAKESTDSIYGEKKNKTEDSFKKQIDKLLSSSENYKKTAEEKSNSLTNIYNQSIKETEEQALKRGLARSSIIIGQIGELEKEKAGELSNVLKVLEENLSNTKTSINELEKEKETALNNLDIEYAIELESNISKIKDDYIKAQKEAIEFNNNIQKLEAEYKLDLDKQKTDKQKTLTELEEKYGSNYTEKLIKEEQFNYLKNYLSSLEKDYSLNLLLTNKDFKNILGDRYSEMYQYLKNK